MTTNILAKIKALNDARKQVKQAESDLLSALGIGVAAPNLESVQSDIIKIAAAGAQPGKTVRRRYRHRTIVTDQIWNGVKATFAADPNTRIGKVARQFDLSKQTVMKIKGESHNWRKLEKATAKEEGGV